MKTLLTNGKIYTANQEHLWVDSMVIEKERITFVGRKEDAPKANVCLDLQGKTIVPGFVDSHTRPGMVSQSSWHIKLPWTEDAKVLLEFIREYAASHPKEEVPFLYFEYYPTSMFDTNGPTKEMLDAVCSDRPCYCQDFGEHLHWMNSKMLELMEVTKDTLDPVPGLEMFVRDEEGNPTGWCKEFAWVHFQDIMFQKIGWTPPIQLTSSLMAPFFEFLTNHGITAIADGLLEGEDQIVAMQELDRQGKLNVYYDGIVRFWSLADLPEKISELKRYQEKYTCKHMKFNTMKLFLDGTNESGNSASLHPFLNDASGTNFGEIKMEMEELKECLLLCNRNGLDLHIHMVGDRAFRTGCDAVEKAQQEAAALGEPWICQPIFAHCEIIDPADMQRPAQLGITINWSCHWSGGYFGDVAQEFFGYEKWARMYQFNPILKSGALVTFSSDVVSFYELHRADPFFSMEVANTRIDPEVPLDPDKYPGSMRPPASARISVEDLLPGYTISGAKQMHWAYKLGSLEVGKTANFNILSANPFEAESAMLHEIYCEKVFFEGQSVWESGKESRE